MSETTAPSAPVSNISYGIFCMNCNNPAKRNMTCPKCQTLGVKDAHFCSAECYKDNYKVHHQKMHKRTDTGAYVFPEGTEEGFGGRCEYTGPLRAVYPVPRLPMRSVPKEIPYPDYAVNAKGISYLEQVTNKSEKFGKVLNSKEIEGMREVCRLGREVLDIAAAAVRPGITTLEIDEIVHNACMERQAYPSPLGYVKFPRSVCTSINEVICHGIPDARPLEDGDIVNLDVTLYYKGFHGDLNATYPVGTKTSERDLALIACSRECLDEAIRVSKPGYLFRDLGTIIEKIAKARGFSVNKTYCGHGINQLFHCAPNVPHYGGNHASGTMKAGMTFTIEPMICTGDHRETHWPDSWTAVTRDGKPSAQFEETLLVTADGVEVLTARKGWTLPAPQAV